MAGYTGIGKINGVAIASISKMTGIAKADVWDISSTPRQSNLYQALTDVDWGSYTQGVNYASFVGVGTTTAAYVQFTITDHTAGDTYNFTFVKTGTQGARIFELRVSEVSGLATITGGGGSDVGAQSGSLSTSITASSTNSTLYIGFRKAAPSSTDTLDIGNFRVTRS